MTTAPRTKLMILVVAGALLFGACGADAEVALAGDLDGAPSSSQTDAADPQEAAVEPVTEVETESAPEVTTVESSAVDTMQITFDGQEMTFEPLICAVLSSEFMSVTGLPLGDTQPDTELVLAYEQPMIGDDDSSEYENSVTLNIGNDSWKAGTLENSVGEQSWGELNWTREGDTVSGTAIMIQSWGVDAENSEPREASFLISCG